jgi:hypothetical protein
MALLFTPKNNLNIVRKGKDNPFLLWDLIWCNIEVQIHQPDSAAKDPFAGTMTSALTNFLPRNQIGKVHLVGFERPLSLKQFNACNFGYFS